MRLRINYEVRTQLLMELEGIFDFSEYIYSVLGLSGRKELAAGVGIGKNMYHDRNDCTESRESRVRVKKQ